RSPLEVRAQTAEQACFYYTSKRGLAPVLQPQQNDHGYLAHSAATYREGRMGERLQTILIRTIVTGLVAWAAWLLFIYVHPYWVARFRGKGADLRAATLVFAPLAHANLESADLCGAN